MIVDGDKNRETQLEHKRLQCPFHRHYKFSHAIYELFQLKSILTLGFSTVFLYLAISGRLEEWNQTVAILVPIVTMILTNFFKKGKDE